MRAPCADDAGVRAAGGVVRVRRVREAVLVVAILLEARVPTSNARKMSKDWPLDRTIARISRFLGIFVESVVF